MDKLIGLLRLMRPANIVTAVSDILAGIAIAAYAGDNVISYPWQSIALLIISTIGLYGGGVVLNDVFDAELDKAERPERPIPTGLISKNAAALWGTVLLLGGIAAAAAVHTTGLFSSSALIAIAIAVCAVVYDKWMKHNSFLGPLNMGFCRGLNLLLGISMFPAVLPQYGYIAIVPVIYIAAITMISRGEVHGGKKNTLYGAVLLYAVVIAGILTIGFVNNYIWHAMAFVVLFSAMIFPPLQRAIRNPAGALMGKAVKAGVIALIVMNAAWAAAFGMIYFALVILLLLPVSLLLAKLFAVT
ncbi:UbiA-like protein EboC [Agriterribacter sp.]|uniref:UbiA-like protein EboC n=1 Tax=Agriterribacter sp. TaxID=2821509 RepID=UPI002BA4BAC5|nr:UbiA-like protein EboC [Agriterribacter sp.]HRO47641.1 UbiA-like protein EboC [Agriterribacter sp.]HRQ17636.1 UbiA-like protein EboC [Agriterribacter sp.]